MTMNKCDCYCVDEQIIGWHTPVDPRTKMMPRCNGTKERESCSCGGDRTKCDFYPDVHQRSLKEQEPKFGEWTSVEDRLPDIENENIRQYNRCYSESIRVLCACKQKSGKVMVKEGYCRIYDDNDIYWRIPGSIDSVTHWMPLPEPPEKEN